MQKEIPIKYRDEKVEIKDLNDKHIEIIIRIRKDYWNTINQRAKENNIVNAKEFVRYYLRLFRE
jgi:hypothetical protein